MKKTIFLSKILILAGILFILGTAGASDLERISLTEAVSKILLGMMMIISGRFGLMIARVKKTALRRKVKKVKTVSVRQAKVA